MVNQSVLVTLPQAQNLQGTFSVISRLDAKAAWSFLVQPVEISYERNSNYSFSNSIGTLPSLQYGNTEGWTCTINNLPLSTFWQGRSLSSYIDALASLQHPDADNFSPPVLAFIWGQRRFSPCVMTRFSKTEKLWFPSGDLAECAISFTLIEVPEGQVVSV
ncbi:MAG: hypothetical protein KME30_32050 [Iphinoe sp. HA4291-MV1]|jgi:hypothetical protein|nr:hypothetical protein [Iphinoe sp. HA4291-MV1]